MIQYLKPMITIEASKSLLKKLKGTSRLYIKLPVNRLHLDNYGLEAPLKLDSDSIVDDEVMGVGVCGEWATKEKTHAIAILDRQFRNNSHVQIMIAPLVASDLQTNLIAKRSFVNSELLVRGSYYSYPEGVPSSESGCGVATIDLKTNKVIDIQPCNAVDESEFGRILKVDYENNLISVIGGIRNGGICFVMLSQEVDETSV